MRRFTERILTLVCILAFMFVSTPTFAYNDGGGGSPAPITLSDQNDQNRQCSTCHNPLALQDTPIDAKMIYNDSGGPGEVADGRKIIEGKIILTSNSDKSSGVAPALSDSGQNTAQALKTDHFDNLFVKLAMLAKEVSPFGRDIIPAGFARNTLLV